MYRLTLDVPYRFAVRQAYEHAQHGIDFRCEISSNIYHNPTYGLTMLRPSCLDNRWVENIVPLSQLEYQPDHWVPAYRGAVGTDDQIRQRAVHLARVLSDGLTQIELLILTAIVAVTSAPKWVVRTGFDLLPDESFALHITGADDEATKEYDFLYLQWGRYGLRLDTQGVLEFYLYDPADMMQPPVLIDRWDSGISNPVRAYSTIAVIPVSPLGILVLTAGGAPSLMNNSSTTRNLLSSKLVPLREYAQEVSQDPLKYRMYDATRLNIAVNTALFPILAVERVRYPESGQCVDRPHDLPPIHPQVPTHQPIIVPNLHQSATTTPLLADGTPWATAQAPTRYKMRMQLTASAGGVYTPVVAGYYLYCEPYIAERDTTPVEVERIKRIELTTDEYSRQEGYAEHVIRLPQESALYAIARRGDTTYKLEYRQNPTENWTVLSAGFAQLESLEPYPVQDAVHSAFRARWELKGFWSRFAELYQLYDTAFDGVTLADAFNKVLIGAGYAPIPQAELPNALKQIYLPSAGTGDTSTGWKYAPRTGQTGDEILTSLLLFALATGGEWRLRYDFGQQRWVLEQKPDGLPPIVIDPATQDLLQRTVRYDSLSIVPEPPEANLLIVEGATVPNREGERLVVQIVNEPSLTDPTSLDYLGRVVSVYLQADSINEIDRLQEMAEYLYDSVCKHRTRYSLVLPIPQRFNPLFLDLILGLPRKVQIVIAGGQHTAWVKRSTLTVEYDTRQRAQLVLEASSEYKSDPREG